MIRPLHPSSVLQLAGWTGGYVLAGLLSTAWFGHGDAGPVVWLPAGVASAAGLLMGWRALPSLAIGGAALAGLQQGGELAGPLLPCLSAGMIALLAPRLLRGRDVLSNAASLLGFLGIATLAFLISGVLLTPPAVHTVAALVTGHVVAAPWLVSWLRPHARRDVLASLSLESAGALVLTAGVGLLIGSGITPLFTALPGLSMLPVLLWASFRLPPPAATSVQLLTGVLLTLMQLGTATAAGSGASSVAASVDPSAITLPLRLVFGMVLMSQLVLAIHRERQRMEHHLSRQAQRLQRLVRLRTQELTEANRRLQALSECDGLTGVANRRHFDQVLEREWRRCLRRGEPLAVGLLDVDHFKAYNDRYGHLKGDETLQRVAQALQQVVGRAEDLVARYGGEEFAVILPGLDRREAALIAERLRSAIEALAIEHTWDGPERRITISGGLVSRIPDAQGDHQTLVAAADQLLYAAKERGRNRVLVQALALDGDVSAAAS